MNRKSLMMSLVALVTALGLLAGCSSGKAPDNTGGSSTSTPGVTLRYTHFQPGTMDQPKHAAALAFKAYVEQNTNGAIKVEIFPAGQLGDAGPVLEQLKLNSIQLAVVHDGPISSVYPPLGVYNLPFAFNGQGEAWAVFDSDFTKEIGEDMRQKTGIRLLALADNGVRHFTNSKREIRSPEDMKDLKIRIQPSPLYEKLVQGTGASPSAIGWTELPSALQSKVVDGQENGVTNIIAASLYQTQKYITLDGHVYSYHAYLISDDFYNSLTPEQQKVVEEGIEIAKWIHRGMTANQDLNAPKILKELGMTVTTLTPQEIEAFRQATQPAVLEWMRSEFGDHWVDGFLKALEEARG